MNKEYLNLLKSDKSNWIDTHCSIPFVNITINSKGDLYNCWCEPWLPKTLGNIMDFNSYEEFIEVFNNNPIRDSIINRSHKFCKGHLCSNLQTKFNGVNPKDFVQLDKLEKMQLNIIKLSIDISCNLSCPTCRNDTIINLHPNFVNDLRKILDKIDTIFFNPRKINYIFLDGIGEFLASKTVFNWMLEKADLGVKFWLQTNGTLINQYQDKIKSILAATDYINVSIDASYKELYEKVRRGGNWEKLMQGLDLLNRMKEDLKFKIRYNFTISNENYHDLPNFINFCDKMKPQHIFFTKIERWEHLSDAQWKDLNVFSKGHPNNAELIKVLNNTNWPEYAVKNFDYKI